MTDGENILLDKFSNLRGYLEGSFDYLEREMQAGTTPKQFVAGPDGAGEFAELPAAGYGTPYAGAPGLGPAGPSHR